MAFLLLQLSIQHPQPHPEPRAVSISLYLWLEGPEGRVDACSHSFLGQGTRKVLLTVHVPQPACNDFCVFEEVHAGARRAAAPAKTCKRRVRPGKPLYRSSRSPFRTLKESRTYVLDL